jgi:signal peptidase II
MKLESRKYWLLGWVVSIGLILDQWSKGLVLKKFSWGESIPVIPGFFNFTYVRNKGAAFGFLHSAPESFREPFFLAVPVIAIFVLGYLFYRLRPDEKLSAWALSLIVSGAAGNLIDRVRLGYVVDFIDFYLDSWGHWPAFNIADSAIVVGVSLLFIQSLVTKKPL